MSRFFDDLEGQLRSAARAHAGATDHVPPAPRRRRRLWPAAGLDLVPVLATLVVVVVVVGAALALLGHDRHQSSPPPASPPPRGGLAALIEKTPQKQLRREFSYISAATKSVSNAPACRLAQPTGTTFLPGAPDRTLLSILGVLRRPRTPADRVNPDMFGDPAEFVYSGYERRAFSAGGESYYVVAVRTDQAAVDPSDRCLALQVRALTQYLPKIPAALRAQTQALQAGYLAYDRNLIDRSSNDSICLVDTGRSDNSSSCGITAAEIEDNLTPDDASGVFIGVVPDGVASVTLSFPAAAGRPAHAVSGAVRSNVYAIRARGSGPPPPEPAVTWRAADGRVLKSIPSMTPTLERTACRKEPVPCALLQDGGLTASTTTTSSGTATAQLEQTGH